MNEVLYGEGPLPRIMKYFRYDHLPEELQKISRPFGLLALEVAARGGDPAEMTTALRKLLEAKDAAVRACLT